MAESKVDYSAIEKALVEHAAEHGMGQWALVREQFPGISDSSFWRAVTKFKKGAAGAMGRQSQKATRKVIREVQRAKDILPVSLAPGTVIEHGVDQVHSSLDYLLHLNEALNAATLLRDSAVVVDADGKTRIKSAKVLRDSARIRLDALRTAASVMAFLADVKRMEQFFSAVVDEVGKESPEVQAAILERLQVLNQNYGMTTAAFL